LSSAAPKPIRKEFEYETSGKKFPGTTHCLAAIGGTASATGTKGLHLQKVKLGKIKLGKVKLGKIKIGHSQKRKTL
jgi:hypothetical protein